MTAARVQAQDSRDEILQAAIHLFAVRGFHETSMAEVARAAGVSKALIFWHFKTKEDLFAAVLNRMLEPYFIDFAEEASILDERQQIMMLVEMYLQFVRDKGDSVRVFLAQLLHGHQLSSDLSGQVLSLYEGFRGMLVDLINRAQQSGSCAPGFSPESAANFLISALNGMLVGSLLMNNEAVEARKVSAMVEEWLFQEGEEKNSGGGKAVA